MLAYSGLQSLYVTKLPILTLEVSIQRQNRQVPPTFPYHFGKYENRF